MKQKENNVRIPQLTTFDRDERVLFLACARSTQDYTCSVRPDQATLWRVEGYEQIRILFLLFLVSFLSHAQPNHKPSALEITATKHQAYKMKVLLGVIGDNKRVARIADIITRDISLPLEKQTGFDVALKQFAKEPRSKKEIKRFLDEGYSLVVFLSATSGDDIAYRLYDATRAAMVHGKRVVITGRSPRATGHHVAGLLMKDLLGRSVQFGTQLAYCKHVSGKNNKHVFVTDPYKSGSPEQVLGSHTPKCGLRWHEHEGITRLYYSEQSPVNVRLMAYDMLQKRSKIVMNFDGLNMQPSFNEDGTKVVVCCSQAGSSQLYLGTLDVKIKQWNFKRLTHNRGNNISPYLCKNGDIIFCSDFQTRRPQLYYYRMKNGKIERLTDGGYCASPAVLEERGLIAYIKLVNSVAQLCLFDINTKQHTQLTFDRSHKDEPTWSPCGSYVAYSVEQGKSSRIAVRNMMSQESYFVTAKNEQCSGPAWGVAATV